MSEDSRFEGVPAGRYVEFGADGFEGRACGIVYNGQSRVISGMPLGGVDTGCLDVETSGLFGYSTIFNSHVPRGGPVNEPFLGIVVGGQTWVLTNGLAKEYDEPKGAFAQPGKPLPSSTTASLRPLDLGPANVAKDIRYWGHYPVADMEFDTAAPVGVSLRAWAIIQVFDVVAPNTAARQ